MMGFDIWKVLQMLYHVLQISKNTLNLMRDVKQLVLHCGTKSKSAATDAARVIHSYFDTFN